MIKTYITHLQSKKQLTEDTYLFTFSVDPAEPLSFTAGQYLILHVPQENGQVARRLYSVASAAYDTTSFELLVKILPNGVASQYLIKLTEQDTVTFQGPAGIFTITNNPQKIVFFATGTGYAPMRSMLLDMIHNHYEGSVELYWGFQYFKDIYYLDELKRMASENPKFSFKLCVSRETQLPDALQADKQYFAFGRITAVWEAQTDKNDSDFYICSGREIVESLRQFLLDKGIPKEKVHSEKF